MKLGKYLVLLLAAVTAHANDGVSTRGGADPRKMDVAAIKLLLQGNGLKKAMLHYLDTLQVDKIADNLVRTTFSRMLRDGSLQKDILTPENYIVEASCKDAYSDDVPASARIGEMGDKICFDAEKLAQAYSYLSIEEATIRLASLAFHEHVHHFQQMSTPSEANEDEAYRLSAYVQITAKAEQVPLLKWSLPSLPSTCLRVTMKAYEVLGDNQGGYFYAPTSNAYIQAEIYNLPRGAGADPLFSRVVTATGTETCLPTGWYQMYYNILGKGWVALEIEYKDYPGGALMERIGEPQNYGKDVQLLKAWQDRAKTNASSKRLYVPTGQNNSHAWGRVLRFLL